MIEGIITFLIGAFFPLCLGTWLTPVFHRALRKNFLKAIDETDHIHPWGLLQAVVGLMERIFFTVFVVIDINSVLIGMIAWIALKMATNWGRLIDTSHKSKGLALCALMGSIFSLLFALIGGLYIRYGLGLIETPL